MNSVLNIKKYGKNDEEFPVWSIRITDKLLTNPDLLNEILGHASFILKRFRYAMYLLDYLETKSKDNKLVNPIWF